MSLCLPLIFARSMWLGKNTRAVLWPLLDERGNEWPGLRRRSEPQVATYPASKVISGQPRELDFRKFEFDCQC